MPVVPVLHIDIPGIAAEAVLIETIKRRGRAAGVTDARFGYSYSGKGRTYRCRVACSREMAAFLSEILRQRSVAAGDPTVIVACSAGVAAIKAATDDSVSDGGGTKA
jgi:hypothetical protein